MAVVEVGHAATAVGGGMGGGAPFEATEKEEPPLAEGVPAAEGDENGAAARVEGQLVAIVEEAGGEGPVEVAGMEGEPPAGGGPAAVVEACVKGAIKADGDEEGRCGVGENEVEANEGAAAAEEEAGEEKWLNHYSSMHNILIVGDGDFSFSLALATAFGCGANLLATTLDTYGSSTSIDSASFCYL